jgi:predicted RNase H-like nuclease
MTKTILLYSVGLSTEYKTKNTIPVPVEYPAQLEASKPSNCKRRNPSPNVCFLHFEMIKQMKKHKSSLNDAKFRIHWNSSPSQYEKKTVVGVFVDCSLTNKEDNLDAVIPLLCNHKLSWH